MRVLAVPLGIALLTTSPVLPVSATEEKPGSIESPGTYVDQIDRFFSTVLDGRYKDAVDELYLPNPWATSMVDDVNLLKGQFASLPDLAGNLHGFDLVVERKLAETFVYRWYVVAYDRSPVSFHFTFYKPADKWYVYSFEYREDLKTLAEELAKMELVYPQSDDSGSPDISQTRPATDS